MNFEHKPVLLSEVIEYLNCKKDGIYVDGTIGRGGHSRKILKKLGDKGLVIGIDRDKEAVNYLKPEFKDVQNIKLFHGNYIQISQILNENNIHKVDGIFLDLGVSSPQLDDPERGFSYSKKGPLDMRMNQDQSFTAKDIVNGYSKSDLTKIIRKYGEENWASRISEFIVNYRKKQDIQNTTELVDIIKNAIPASARRKGGHPARRTFQALRIETNNELNQLEKVIKKSVKVIKNKGRICIISFHSLEDRIVKHTFRELAKDCVCPPDFPECVCDKISLLNIITKSPVQPLEKEIENNPRARSAKLRVAEKKKEGD